jgi:hypothetical protein
MKISIIAIAFVIFNFLLSPEIGAAFLLSLIMFYLLNARKEIRYSIILVNVFLFIGIACYFLSHSKFFLIFSSFSTGGNNWAIIASPSIVLYFLSIFIVYFISATKLIKETKFLQIALMALSIFLLPGALSRCDPGHILFYGIGTFVLCFGYLSLLPTAKPFKLYCITFVLIFIIGGAFSTFYMYSPGFARLGFLRIMDIYGLDGLQRIGSSLAPIINKSPEKVNNYISRLYNDTTVNLNSELAGFSQIATPLGAPENVKNYLKATNKYMPEYYESFCNVFTKSQIQDKLADLQKPSHHYILIASGQLKSISNLEEDIINNRNNTSKFITYLFLYPFNLRIINDTLTLFNPIYIYIIITK